MSQFEFHKNNFDLIRLFAAIQVLTFHAFSHLSMNHEYVLDIINYLPGVPIFFFVSGYLVPNSHASVTRNGGGVLDYFRNRILRLFPALWICFILSVMMVFLTGYFSNLEFRTTQFAFWVLAQNSAFQFYNPDFMRDFGVGVLNGSLWTISVEIQFYLLVPLLFIVAQRSFYALVAVAVIFLIFNQINTANVGNQSFIAKLFSVSFIPWIYMFLLGYLFSLSSRMFSFVQSVPIGIWILGYALACYFSNGSPGNYINPISMFALSCLIIKFAYWRPNIAQNCLRGHDISYGLYIYHMPIINLMIYLNPTMSIERKFALTYLLVLVAAICSWLLVERPALRLKRKSARFIKPKVL